MARGGAGSFVVSRMFADDEELGKKDDDHKPSNGFLSSKAGLGGSWQPAKMVSRRNRKRWITISIVIFCIWAFFHYMPDDILEPSPRNGAYGTRGRMQTQEAQQLFGYQKGPGPEYNSPSGQRAVRQPKGAPPRSGKKTVNQEELDHYYDGDIRFYLLPTSLHGISRTNGYQKRNNNALFAASSLKSASVLIPLACEMARWENNFVHLVLVGRSDLSLEEIRDINGVDKDGCKVFWHDARPDYARYSSDFRAEAAVAAALDHVDTFMHPQVVITDDSMVEDVWFTRQIRIKAGQYEWPVIELPQGLQDRLKWITRLESKALAAWHRSSIDIVVQAPTESYGSLMRLLKSLSIADYSGLTPPRITIELPPEIDIMTMDYLHHFAWPPKTAMQPIHSSKINIRHRIPGQKISPEEASVRFLESFYPANPQESHVLLLAANAQLSPMYFQYLKYALLHHKYSQFGSLYTTNLLGFSLDIPTTYLNGSATFQSPRTDPLDLAFIERTKPVSKDTKPPFLWEAPNSNAALYFGDKWVELHSFLQHRLTKFHATPKSASQKKSVSEQFPAWMEYFLEYMRARGYALLYPPSSPGFESLVTIHNELYQPPEEFTKPKTVAYPEPSQEEPPPLSEPFLTPKPDFIAPPKTSEQVLAATQHQPLHALLPFDGPEPDLTVIPHMAYNGVPLVAQDMFEFAEKFGHRFRKEVGGCGELEAKRKADTLSWGDAGDLFCEGGEGSEDVGSEKMKREEAEAEASANVTEESHGTHGTHVMLGGIRLS